MRIRLGRLALERLASRRLAVTAAALLTTTAALPATAAQPTQRQEHPSHGGLSAVIRYTEYGIPHMLAKNYADRASAPAGRRPPTRCAHWPTVS